MKKIQNTRKNNPSLCPIEKESFSRNFDNCYYICDQYHDKNVLRLL